MMPQVSHMSKDSEHIEMHTILLMQHYYGLFWQKFITYFITMATPISNINIKCHRLVIKLGMQWKQNENEKMK